jgi:hypothetical protein
MKAHSMVSQAMKASRWLASQWRRSVSSAQGGRYVSNQEGYIYLILYNSWYKGYIGGEGGGERISSPTIMSQLAVRF